jgi:hypothetical protein
MKCAMLSIVLLLAGCAPPSVIGATAAGGMVTKYSAAPNRAAAAANDYCAKKGKIARISGHDTLNDRLFFDCVSS